MIKTLSLVTILASFSSYASPTIIGGQEVTSTDVINQQTVGLYFVTKDNHAALCSGSILDSSRILTAAHCVTNIKGGFVIFSNKNIHSLVSKITTAEGDGVRVFPMTNIHQFPGYPNVEGAQQEYTDLAIITFRGNMPLGYRPAKFLSGADYSKSLTKSSPIILAGYGVADNITGDNDNHGSGTLRKVTVAFSGIGSQRQNIYVQGQLGHIACHGDSGGPALAVLNNQTYVVGVASRSNCNDTSIYTAVYKEILAPGSL